MPRVLAVNLENANIKEWRKWPIIQCQIPGAEHNEFQLFVSHKTPDRNRQLPSGNVDFGKLVKSENNCNKNCRVSQTHGVLHSLKVGLHFFFFRFHDHRSEFTALSFPLFHFNVLHPFQPFRVSLFLFLSLFFSIFQYTEHLSVRMS